MDSENKLYEIAYLIGPALSETEAHNFHQAIKSTVQEDGGLIDNEGEVAKKRLAYPIQKTREAYLAHFRFLLPQDKISAFKTALAKPEIIRYLLVHTKRVLQRRPQVFQQAASNKLPEEHQHKSLIQPAVKTAEDSASKPPPAKTETSIEEIDKKLEEILGK